MSSRRRQLRIAVRPDLTTLESTTGVGRIWVRTLDELARRADVFPLSPERRRWPRARPDVWLNDSSWGALTVAEPVVTMVHEAAWDQPDLRAMLEPDFLAVTESRTADAVAAATAVLTNSGSTRDQVVAMYGTPSDRVHVGYAGVDHDMFRPRAGIPAIVADHSSAPYILFAGSIHPRKNLAAVRDALGGLAGRGFPHNLVVVGAPAYDRHDSTALEQALLGEIPGAAGRLIQLPFPLPELQLAEVMAGASAFCLPSLMEGLGIPVLEAMASGTPVVVSDRGALPEIVGTAGIVTEPTAAAFEDALAGLLSDEARCTAISAAARARAGLFTWGATADVWLAACTQAAADGGRADVSALHPALAGL